MASKIEQYLNKILSSRFGKDVRQSIHDGIKQCYSDVTNPDLNVDAFETAVQNKIDSGALAAMTIADGSITKEKLDRDITKNIETNTQDITNLKSDLGELDKLLDVDRSKAEATFNHSGGWSRTDVLNDVALEKEKTYRLEVVLDNVHGNTYVYLNNGSDLISAQVSSTPYKYDYKPMVDVTNAKIQIGSNDGVVAQGSLKIGIKNHIDKIEALENVPHDYGVRNGYVYKLDGVIEKPSTLSNCVIVDKVKCDEGDKFIYHGKCDYNYACAIYFNNDNVIGYEQTGHAVETKEITIPNGCNYVGFSSYDTEDFYVFPKVLHATGWYYQQLKDVNPLFGKKLCCDGDSIMYGAGNNGNSFADIIAAKNGMTLNKIAVSGATIRTGTTYDDENNRHWISESIGTMDSDGDYYIFDGWVNDVNSQTNLGTVSWGYEPSLDTTIFCEAFEQCCKTLVETYKGKKVGYVFVHRLWQPTDELVNSFIDKMIEILKKWGIPYINLMEEVPPLNLITDLKNTYTNNGDGWHPNEDGYMKYYVPKIEAWLKTL